MIYHPYYSIIHISLKILSPSFQVLYLWSTRNVRKEYTKLKHKMHCDLFHLLFYRAEVTFLFNWRDLYFFFFSIILSCIIGYCVIILFQKAAINNILISKECLCDLCCEINKLHNNRNKP